MLTDLYEKLGCRLYLQVARFERYLRNWVLTLETETGPW